LHQAEVRILDNCDIAGVWKVDLELAGHYTVNKWDFYKKADCLEVLKNRIYPFGEDDSEKWFIIKFIEFQYDKLLYQKVRA